MSMSLLERLKRFHRRLAKMCEWEECTKESYMLVMGARYCTDHIQAADVMWEKAMNESTGDKDDEV